MATMGRRRKTDTGLQPRVYAKHGAFYYVHRAGNWEHLGADKDRANAKARLYNDPGGKYGTMVYWLDMFLVECARRVALNSDIKGIGLSPRTLRDYADAIGSDDRETPLRIFLAPPRTPLDVTPDVVQQYLTENAEAKRAVRANRDRAALSSCFGWLLRNKKVPGLLVNPCLRGSGVQRNPESKRERYVTHAEYRDVYDVATRAERLLMELTYRTLQRPQSDIIVWDMKVVVTEGDRRLLRFRQNKTGTPMVIGLTPALDDLIPKTLGKVRKLQEPLVRRLDGLAYTYDGLSSMLKRSIATANERRKARGVEPMPAFGYRDLKGKGATDMWLAGEPIEKIQALLGHASKSTTEIYVKQRWHEAATPNMVQIA